jgi:sialate O-acetylesterase
MYRFTLILAMAGLSFLSPTAPALDITAGLTDYQVVQCEADGTAALALSGTATETGALEARVLTVQKTVVDWTPLGEASATWTATLPAVPAGGPYRVEVRVSANGAALASDEVLNVLVGDVWILAGQSNMQGVGNRVDEETPDPRVNTFSMSYEWRVAQEPLHTLPESPDAIHFDPNLGDAERQKQISGWRDGHKGTGLGLAFAKEMVRRTGRPVGLIASAHGGTSMAGWNPALKDQGGASLYGSMCKQVAAAGGKVRGVLWYQGESETNAEASAIFPQKFQELIEAMRRDFNNPELPFYFVQLGRVILPWDQAAWNNVQAAQLNAVSQIPNTAVVPAVDLGLNDGIHIGTPGLKTLGHRLANIAEANLFGGKILAGPRVAGMTRVGTGYGQHLRVTFSGVNGRLVAAGRPSGFSVSEGPAGEVRPLVFNVEIAPDDPNALLIWVNEFPKDAQLWYGRGTDPFCNITDEAGMALPVFGPMAIPE